MWSRISNTCPADFMRLSSRLKCWHNELDTGYLLTVHIPRKESSKKKFSAVSVYSLICLFIGHQPCMWPGVQWEKAEEETLQQRRHSSLTSTTQSRGQKGHRREMACEEKHRSGIRQIWGQVLTLEFGLIRQVLTGLNSVCLSSCEMGNNRTYFMGLFWWLRLHKMSLVSCLWMLSA